MCGSLLAFHGWRSCFPFSWLPCGPRRPLWNLGVPCVCARTRAHRPSFFFSQFCENIFYQNSGQGMSLGKRITGLSQTRRVAGVSAPGPVRSCVRDGPAHMLTVPGAWLAGCPDGGRVVRCGPARSRPQAGAGSPHAAAPGHPCARHTGKVTSASAPAFPSCRVVPDLGLCHVHVEQWA